MSNGKNIPLKVYASPENLNKTSYAGYVGQKAIEYYIKYFNIPYPLPKLGEFFLKFLSPLIASCYPLATSPYLDTLNI